MTKMDLILIESIQNGNCPKHLIYKDPSSGLYGECFKIDGGLVFSDIPLCENLAALRQIITGYDNWLADFRAVGGDWLTHAGLSNHKAAVYWRTYKLHNKELR